MMKRVWCTTSMVEAECMAALLRGHDVNAWVENANSHYAIGIPTPATPFYIVVPGIEADAAIAVLKEDRSEDSPRFFNLGREEDERFTRAVHLERDRHRWAWWFVVLVMTQVLLPLFWFVAAVGPSREDRD